MIFQVLFGILMIVVGVLWTLDFLGKGISIFLLIIFTICLVDVPSYIEKQSKKKENELKVKFINAKVGEDNEIIIKSPVISTVLEHKEDN